MLNTNKIESDINYKNLSMKDLSEILEIPYTTTIDRYKKGNWSANDVEKLAVFFKRTIAYYFDNEEVATKANCANCEMMQKKIDDLIRERDEYRQKYIECLEDIREKKKASGWQ